MPFAGTWLPQRAVLGVSADREEQMQTIKSAIEMVWNECPDEPTREILETTAQMYLWAAFSQAMQSSMSGLESGVESEIDDYASIEATRYERKVRDRFGL